MEAKDRLIEELRAALDEQEHTMKVSDEVNNNKRNIYNTFLLLLPFHCLFLSLAYLVNRHNLDMFSKYLV